MKCKICVNFYILSHSVYTVQKKMSIKIPHPAKTDRWGNTAGYSLRSASIGFKLAARLAGI